MKKEVIISTFLYFSVITLQNLAAQSNEQVRTQESMVMSLREIDELIKSKNYNLALTELAAYMRANPKDFDRAQKRVAKIINSRIQYNTKAERLADAMKNDGKSNSQNMDATDTANYSEKDRASDQEKLDIIMELENREQNQTETAEELTRQARKALALRFYISRYNKIMEEGYTLLSEERYEEALSKFQEGFNLKQNDSDKIYTAENLDGIPVTYDEDITVPIDEILKGLEKTLLEFSVLRLNCQSAYEAFIQAVQARDYSGAIAANEKVQKEFRLYADLRNRIQIEVNKLEEIDKIANKRNPGLKGFSYITFTLGFISGDKDIAETGVLGTMDAFWNTRIENMKNSLYELTLNDMDLIKNTLPTESIRKKFSQIPEQKTNTLASTTFPDLGGGIQHLHEEIILNDGMRFCKDFKEYEKSMEFVKKFASSLRDTLEVSRLLSDDDLKKYSDDIEDGNFIASHDFLESHLDAAVRYEEIMNKSVMESYISEELEREKSYFKNKDIIDHPEKYSAFEVTDAMTKQKKPEKTPGAQVEDAVLDYRSLIDYQQKLAQMNFDESKGNTLGLWGGLATLFATNAEDTVDNYSIMFDRADTLMKGIKISQTQEENEEESDSENPDQVKNNKESIVTRKYPREAKKVADQIILDISNHVKDFKDWRQSLAKGEKYRATIKEYDKGTNDIDKSILELEELLRKSGVISTQAEGLVKTAERAFDEAQQNFRRAVEALEKQNFTNARNYLSMSSKKYAESFNIQESISQRSESDRMIAELSERIVREENELVIAEVRELINEAQDSYYEGNLDYAEKRLVMAQNRWSVTNTEKNEEIESLLELVSSARKLQIGRKLKTTDPLYSDMSQLLSVANQFYEEGEKLMKQGKRDEGTAALNLAKEKLEPMKLIYPLNDDAALIRLKIEKELDPESFKTGFKRKVDEANSKPAEEKLASLETLLKVNPSYPGLAKQVEELQYDLGIKTRPTVTKTALKNGNQVNDEEENRKRAENLYSQANSIFNSAGNNQSQLQRASALLDEIIRMYSRDRRNSIFRQATALKDRIQSRIGGTVVAVLTADDEVNFQRAQNYVNRGNYDAANDILEKLWKNPAAQKTKKIIDLRTFVKNRL